MGKSGEQRSFSGFQGISSSEPGAREELLPPFRRDTATKNWPSGLRVASGATNMVMLKVL